MNDFLKNTWAFWGLVIIAVGLTFVIVMPISAEQPFEIDENQEISVNDEIIQTIHVELADGVTSVDDIQ